MRVLMSDWGSAGMLPQTLCDELLWLFPAIPAEAVRIHLAAFNWWFRMPPDKDSLLKLGALLRRLPLDQADKQWIADSIRRAQAYDPDVEAMLRG